MITTSPVKIGTPLTRTSRSDPAVCFSRRMDPSASCAQSPTLIVVLPSTKSTGQGTSISHRVAAAAGTAGAASALSELNNELGEEDIDHFPAFERRGRPRANGFLQCRLAFGRHQRGARLFGQ